MPSEFWTGSLPVKCEVGGEPIGKTFVDGKLRAGPWAVMCAGCHEKFGLGLGAGRGQKYRLARDGNLWIKVEG